MAASVVQVVSGAFPGTYAPNVNFAATTTAAADGLVVFFASHSSSITAIPTVTIDGKAMALVGIDSPAQGGTVWAWTYNGTLAAGSHTVNLQCPNTYLDVGQLEQVYLTGTTAVGAKDIKEGGGTSLSFSVTTADANSIVISAAYGYYSGGTLNNTAASPTATNLPIGTQPDSNQTCAIISQPGNGAAVTSTWTVPYNQVVGIAVEMKGASGSGGGGGGGATSTGTETASLALTSAEAGTVAVTGTSTASMALTGAETGTTAASNSSTGNFALTSAEAGTVAVTGTSTASLRLTAIETSSQEGAPLALADSGTRYSIARTGAATYRDSSGVMQAVAANGPRLEAAQKVSLGVMVEEASANLVRDSIASAAVANGAMPAGASFYNGGVAGITCTVVGTGQEDGVDYVDLRFQGTNNTSSTIYPGYSMSGATDCPVAANDTLVLSAYMRVTAGSVARPSDGYPMVALGINTYDSTSNYVASLPLNPPLLNTDKLVRDWLATSVPSSGNSAYAVPQLAINIPANVSLDCTVRLGLPQLEKGKTRPTTAIKTSGTAGVARGLEAMTYLTSAGTKDIQVEYCDVTGKRTITTYAAQSVGSSGWPVPAVALTPYVRRISSTTALDARAAAVTSASAKGWSLGVAFKLSDYNNDNNYAALIRAQAAIYCPEYEFKMDQLQTSEGTFSYTVADNYAAQATTDSKKLRGHCLIWYAATPSWCNSVLTSSPTTARWQGIIDSHIKNVVNRWTQVTTWDVANECFEPTDGISGGYRNSAWYQGCGSGYIAYAFQRAKAYNTTAKLHLAEYGLEENDAQGQARRTAVLNWLTSAVQAGVPIDGLSLQCHLDLERPFSASAYTAFLQNVANLGLSIIVTELDVRAPVNYNTLGYDLKAAERVRNVLDCITAVTKGTEILCWDYSDTYTWLTAQFPSRTERPTPFDTANAPKAMYAALQQEFESVAPTAGGSSGTATSTGTSTAALALTSADAGTVAITGTEAKGLALTAAEAGTVAVTGSSTGGLVLSATDTGSDIATGSSTGSLALTNGGEAGLVQATGSSTAALSMTSADTGLVVVTGTESSPLALTSAEAGQAIVTGTVANGYVLTATEAGGSAATGSATGNFALTSAEAGVSTVTGSASTGLAVVSTESGAVSITGTSSTNQALASSETGAVTATGQGQAGLLLSSAEAGTTPAAGTSSGNFALAGSGSGLAQATGNSSSSLALTAAETGTEPATGSGSGSFVITSSEQATGQYVSTGSSTAGFSFTSAQSGAVAVAGTSTATLAATAVSTGTAPATGASAGSLLTTSGEAGTVTVSGQQSATLAVTAPSTEFGSVRVTGQQNANEALTASQSGSNTATGTLASGFADSGSGAGTVAATGASSSTLLLTSADLGSVSVTGTSNAGAALTSTESGSAPATGTSQGSLSLGGVGAGSAAATGTSAAALAVTGAGTGAAVVTGSHQGAFGLTAAEAGAVSDSGQSTATIKLTGQQTSGAGANGYETAGFVVSSSAAGTVSDAGTQSALLAVTGSGTGTVAAVAACAGGFVLTSSQTGTLLATGNSAGFLTVQSAEGGTATPLTAGSSTSALVLQGTSAGSLSIVGSSAAGFALTASGTGAVTATGQGAGGFALTSIETVTAKPISQGAGAGGFVLTAADTATVGITGAGAGGFAFSGNEAAQAPESGVCSGMWVLTASQTATGGITGSSATTLALTSAAAATVSLTGQGTASLALSSAEAGAVPIAGQGSGSLALTGSGSAAAVSPTAGSSTATIALTAVQTGGVTATAELFPASFRFGQQQTASNPVAGSQVVPLALRSLDLGVVMIGGQGVGDVLLRAIEWSRQENPGAMAATLELSAIGRAVMVKPENVRPMSGRSAVATGGSGGASRVAVAPRVGSAVGFGARVAKVS